MKIIQSFLVLLMITSTSLSAQILEPVKWKFSTEEVSNTEHNLVFTASIDKGWTVYSQFTSDDGPVPTLLTFESKDGAELVGSGVETGHKKEGLDKLFDVNVIKYLADEKFVIKQKVNVSDDSKPISGYLTFMTCNDKTCLPPTDIDFTFNVKNNDQTKVAGQGGVDEASTNSPSTFSLNSSDDQKPSGLLEPVKWKMHKEKLSDNEYELTYTGSIDNGWAVYSLSLIHI